MVEFRHVDDKRIHLAPIILPHREQRLKEYRLRDRLHQAGALAAERIKQKSLSPEKDAVSQPDTESAS